MASAMGYWSNPLLSEETEESIAASPRAA